jgi:hypothetical protein
VGSLNKARSGHSNLTNQLFSEEKKCRAVEGNVRSTTCSPVSSTASSMLRICVPRPTCESLPSPWPVIPPPASCCTNPTLTIHLRVGRDFDEVLTKC